MIQQEQVLSHDAEGVVPEQRNGVGTPRRAAQLRVDARRNLESVLRAAREVFGELGYGAPMEEVARRAGVGVGTVYRRFPSKEVLVHRIASEEVQWLTTQAWESLGGEQQPWDALAGYLSRAVATGAGRLLPPEAFWRAQALDRAAAAGRAQPSDGPGAELTDGPGTAGPGAAGTGTAGPGTGVEGGAEVDPARLVELLELLARLVERARAAGELRTGVSVADVVLVLTASVPAQPTPGADAAGSEQPDGGQPGSGQPGGAAADGGEGVPESTAGRLLRLLLAGLRAAA